MKTNKLLFTEEVPTTPIGGASSSATHYYYYERVRYEYIAYYNDIEYVLNETNLKKPFFKIDTPHHSFEIFMKKRLDTPENLE